MSKNPERTFSAQYPPLGQPQLREALWLLRNAVERQEIKSSEHKSIKESWLAFYERFQWLKDIVLEANNERAFFDACANFFDIALPKKSEIKSADAEEETDAGKSGESAPDAEVDYKEAKKLFVHWGRLADDVIDKCDKEYFCGEPNAGKLGLYNEVKENIPLKLLSLTNDEDAKRAFQAMRKLFLMYTFGSISSYLSPEISLESVTEDSLDQEMASDLNRLSQRICEKDDEGRVKDIEKPMNIIYDPKCNGRVRIIETLDEKGAVAERTHYIYEDLGETEEAVFNIDRDLCITRRESMTMRLVKTDDGASVPAFIESRPAKRLLAYAFKILRMGVPPKLVRDYKGWHAVTITKEDARRILPGLLQAAPQEFNTEVKDRLPRDKILRDEDKGDIHVVNTKFHRVSWETARYGEGQVFDLVNYWNQFGVGREEHDFFRALQNIRLFPILYPEHIYGMRFGLSRAMYNLFDVIYRRHRDEHASEYHARLEEVYNSDPENIKLLEEEFYRKFAMDYRKEFIEQKFKPLFSADFQKSEAEPQKALLNASEEEAKEILRECGVSDCKEVEKCLKNIAVIKENSHRLFTVLSKQAAELMAFVKRDKVGAARYNTVQNMLSDGAAREVSHALIEILLKEYEFVDEREENNNNDQ